MVVIKVFVNVSSANRDINDVFPESELPTRRSLIICISLHGKIIVNRQEYTLTTRMI